MKPIYEKLVRQREEGFALKTIEGPSFDCPWHFHSEYELILVIESDGCRVVGDSVEPLTPNDLVFLGPNLPHIYQNDGQTPGRGPLIRGVLLQFEESGWSALFAQPAFDAVRRLLRRASLGLSFSGTARDQAVGLLTQMLDLQGVPRVAAFLSLLDLLAQSRHARPLASPGFTTTVSPHDEERVNRVWRFIHENLDSALTLPAAARLVHMSEGAFSRFFHAHLGKTFPDFVNELRVGRACRLLAETPQKITEIALACGYRNLSNFNRQFARLKQCTPREFRRALVRKVSVMAENGGARSAGERV